MEELNSAVSEAKTTGILDPEKAKTTEEFFRQISEVGLWNRPRAWRCE